MQTNFIYSNEPFIYPKRKMYGITFFKNIVVISSSYCSVIKQISGMLMMNNEK